MSNQDDLKLLYKRISVLEMIEKFKAGGLVWNQLGPAQFRTTVEQDAVWDITMTKNFLTGVVTVDFAKNATFFYSMTSEDDSGISTFFEEVVGDEDFQKDQDLWNDVSGFEGCNG